MRNKNSNVPWKKALFCTTLALTSMSVHAGTTMTGTSENGQMPMATAQDLVTVTGHVSDAMGPMIGATVMEKGTSNGCVTDLSGQFTLKVKSADAVLIVSSVGYTTQEIKLRGRKTLNVTLAEDNKLLNEVVVVGYGTFRVFRPRSLISCVV